MMSDEQKIVSEAFDKWFDDPDTQGMFDSSQATERNIASSSFDQGFELAKSMFLKHQDIKLPVPPVRPKSRIISENFVLPFMS